MIEKDENGKVLFIIPDVYQEDNHFPLHAYFAKILRKNGVEVSLLPRYFAYQEIMGIGW